MDYKSMEIKERGSAMIVKRARAKPLNNGKNLVNTNGAFTHSIV